MTTQPDYSKIYSHTPEQHPNLILGSLQLLFWMFFLPKAFKNHLKRIHPVLEIERGCRRGWAAAGVAEIAQAGGQAELRR